MPKVLLVEDNEINREMLSRRLIRRGWTVVMAADGFEAVEMVSRERPDVVLMDMSLPVMNGWDATRAIKQNPGTAEVPIIALTAHAMVGDRESALAAGCDDFATKPVEFERLIALMTEWTERKSLCR
jgi:CheY-like chemotaxis protein